jgi:hypothetical protein
VNYYFDLAPDVLKLEMNRVPRCGIYDRRINIGRKIHLRIWSDCRFI